MKLLSYKFKMFVPFGDGEFRTVYELRILKTYFFGLFKKEIVMDYNISMFGNTKAHTDHWDNLISTGEPL
jgi:hypothetical protein